MSNICGEPDKQRGTQFWQSFGYSLANLIGAGSLIEKFAPTPLDNIQSQIQKQKADTQNTINASTLAFTKSQDRFDADTLQLFKDAQATLEKEAAFHDEILREKISSNTSYITYLFILFLIVYIYIIMK